MQNLEHFNKEYMDTILVNAYPYKSYVEMGLENENEAYAATQLAVYEMVSRRNIADVTYGVLYIKNVSATSKEYSDSVNRIKNSATNLIDLALNHEYDNSYNNSVTKLEEAEYKYDSENKTGLIGPFKSYIEYTEEVKRLSLENTMGKTEFKVINYVPEYSSVKVVDENMNEIQVINNDLPYYIQIQGEEKYCAGVLIRNSGEFLVSEVYKNDTSNSKYVILDTYIACYSSLYSINKNIDVGRIKVSIVDKEGNAPFGTKYYILNDKKEVIFDVEGYSINNFLLPLGKYYIKEYSAPDNYLLNLNEYEVDLTIKDEAKEVKIIQDKLF